MSFWHRVMRPFASPWRWAALLAGALMLFAFPGVNAEFLGWVGLVPGLLLMRAAPSAREAVVRGWWFGTGFMLAVHYWLAPNLGPALLLVAVVLGALWTGVGASTWALLAGRVTALRALAALVVIPSYWLVIEWIRSWQALGGPWGLLGASQWQHPVVLALAAVGGVWLISFLLAAANVGIVVALAAPRLAVRLAGAGALAVTAAAGPAAYAMVSLPPPTRYITIAIVQPGIQHDPRIRVDASQRLTGELAGHRADLIVWGESSIAYDLRRDHTLLRQIESLSARNGAEILADQDSLIPGGKSKVAVLVSPHGIEATYVKTRLVPFGEYIPFRQQLGWLARISKAAPVNMIPGSGARVMAARLPGGHSATIGVLICFEAAFPDMSRVDARHGAQAIVYQTSDSTFQESWAPAQHASLVAVRAAETGRPAVQAALTGVTAAFDSRGRLLAWLGTSERGVTFVRVGLMPHSALTPFGVMGDVVPWTAMAIAAVTVGIGLNRIRGRKRGIGIMENGNRQPVPSVSIPEVTESGHPAEPAPPGRTAEGEVTAPGGRADEPPAKTSATPAGVAGRASQRNPREDKSGGQ
jgi:apolipoprotein N-acyltransferase